MSNVLANKKRNILVFFWCFLRGGEGRFFYKFSLKELEDNENSSEKIVLEMLKDLEFLGKNLFTFFQSRVQIVTFSNIIFPNEFFSEYLL